jgi:predicted AlkP superfamily phosphohydrolase/phosphomutase
MSRVLIVGIDGGTFDLIGPWAQAGDLPNLARLMAEGAHGPLESTHPPVTSPAWPSFATGRNPGEHGVFDFIRASGGDFDLVNATSLRAKTLWQLLSEAGQRVGVMNVPVTYPPLPVNGFLISGMPVPIGGRFTYPAQFLGRYHAQLPPYRLGPSVQYKPGQEGAFIQDLLDLTECWAQYALRLLCDHADYEFLMFHFQSTDVMQHALWRFVDPAHPLYDAGAAARYGPAVKQAYAIIDRFIGHALERVGDDTSVLVMSDHGFGPLHYVVNLNLLFLEHGLLSLKRGAWTRAKAALFRAGLTPAGLWRWIEHAGLQNYVWQVSRSTRNKVVSKFLSFDDVDWTHTRAYSIGHVGQVYINLRGRQPHGSVAPGADYATARQQVLDALATLRHPVNGKPLVERVIPAQEVVHGPYAACGPDLYLVMDGYHTIAFPLFATDERIITRQIRGDSGCHQPYGILIAWGKDVRAGSRVEGARIYDLAPTVLHLLGQPVPDDMEGHVLEAMLTLERPVIYEPSTSAGSRGRVADEQTLSAEETAQVEDRLRALGYLG